MKNILNYKFGFYLLIVVLIGIFVIDSVEEDYDDDEITKAQVKETISSFFSSIEIGSELGSDVPSCIMSKDLRLTGYGKEIKRKKFPNNYYFLLVYPNIKLSTKSVFQHYSNFNNLDHKSKQMSFEKIIIHNSLLHILTFGH